MTILPVILELMSPDNLVNTASRTRDVCLSGAWLGKCAFSFRNLLALHDHFVTTLFNNNLTPETYMDIVRNGEKLIINDNNLIITLSETEKIYPNDPCPCGSGRKYKKCHGIYLHDPMW